MVSYINKLMLSHKKIYVLKIDIKKYFYNIDHHILLNKLNYYIKDEDDMNIIKIILNSTNELYINETINKLKKVYVKKINKLKISEKEKMLKIVKIRNIPIYKPYKGLPIGNMTSQILAVFYLNDIDHFIKEKLHCKYYIRYMDDLVIIDNDFNKLKNVWREINNEIYKLKLEVNNKSNIYSLDNGFSFLGYTFNTRKGNLRISCNNKTYRRIRKHLKYLQKKDFDEYQKSFNSYKGYFMRCNYHKK